MWNYLHSYGYEYIMNKKRIVGCGGGIGSDANSGVLEEVFIKSLFEKLIITFSKKF